MPTREIKMPSEKYIQEEEKKNKEHMGIFLNAGVKPKHMENCLKYKWSTQLKVRKFQTG